MADGPFEDAAVDNSATLEGPTKAEMERSGERRSNQQQASEPDRWQSETQHVSHCLIRKTKNTSSAPSPSNDLWHVKHRLSVRRCCPRYTSGDDLNFLWSACSSSKRRAHKLELFIRSTTTTLSSMSCDMETEDQLVGPRHPHHPFTSK